MYQKLYQNNRYQSSYIQFVADTVEDVKRIPTKMIAMGSEIYVIENRKTYILDSKGVWHSKSKVSGDGDDVIVCDCVEESTIWEELPNS